MCQALPKVLLVLSLYFIPYTSVVLKSNKPLILLLSSNISHYTSSPLFTKFASNESCAP